MLNWSVATSKLRKPSQGKGICSVPAVPTRHGLGFQVGIRRERNGDTSSRIGDNPATCSSVRFFVYIEIDEGVTGLIWLIYQTSIC